MNQKFEAAANAALCNFLSTTGSAAASYAAWGLFTPGPFDEWAALGYAGVAGLAYGAGCSWDPAGPAPPFSQIDGCAAVSGGSGTLEVTIGGVFTPVGVDSRYTTVTRITNTSVFLAQDGSGWVAFVEFDWGTDQQSSYAYTGFNTQEEAQAIHWRINVTSGSCSDTQHPTPEPVPPVVYTDPDDGCQINVTFQGYAVQDGGLTGAAWLMEPVTQLRAGGGIIGGCNFSPVIYYQPPGGGGGSGGGTYIPYNPGPPGPGGEPWWMDVLRGALGGVVGAGVKAILDEILQGSVGGKVYRITSVCETDSQGEPISQSVEVDIPTLPWDEAIIYRLDALEHIMQGLKDFRQPICKPQKAVGELVTVHFESDTPSIAGERPLRKYLRYRDQMASDLAAHAAHWENFVWEAGPVIVSHVGAAWGELQVWAISADEGKDVIRHAGIIAGISPDTEGEWEVTSSGDPRYGMTGTMRLARRKSNQGMVLRISKRGGPDGLPIVPVDPLP